MKKILIILIMLFFAVLTSKQLQATILMTDTVLKQALIKKLPLAITSMINMDKRLEAIKKHPQDIIPMTSMVRKLVVTRQILMV